MIPAEIYTRLSPPERIRAAISAFARKDGDEVARLNNTCPRKIYRMADAEYLDGVERWLKVSLAVECDLQGLALDWMLYAKTQQYDDMDAALESLAALAAAWRMFVEDHGISAADMDAAGPQRHHVVKGLLGIAGEAIPELTQLHLDALRELHPPDKQAGNRPQAITAYFSPTDQAPLAHAGGAFLGWGLV